ncbi:cell division protein FtsX [Helicobacter baculiformis]|uniref:Cell division protein FtsX n=1 Tax=Helicobacter baculiformis TaxID=427351 RepID=A0ABV7ZH52_9HELI|nr:cell division protein FtsX [Helicobacter baculiformis]
MNTLKEHLAFLLPLIALLVGLESVLWIQRALNIRETQLSKNYTIAIVSQQKLSLEFIRQNIRSSATLEIISPDALLERLQQNISPSSLANLKKSLPFFYSLKLQHFPTSEELKHIHDRLLRIPGVSRVEVFSKTHDQEYRLLLLLKESTLVFAFLVGLLSILLLIKQVSVWNLQYSKRIEIMELLGAPMRIKNGFLFRLALVDSVLASVGVLLGSLYLNSQEKFQIILNTLELHSDLFVWHEDLAIFLGASLSVSLACVWIVVVQRRST